MPHALPGRPGAPPYVPTSGGIPHQLTKADRESLAFLRNRATRYEIEVIRPLDKTRAFLAYTERKSLAGLLDALRPYHDALCRWLPLTPMEAASLRAGRPDPHPSIHFSTGAIVRFSGRTARDAVWDGPARRLPRLATLLEG